MPHSILIKHEGFPGKPGLDCYLVKLNCAFLGESKALAVLRNYDKAKEVAEQIGREMCLKVFDDTEPIIINDNKEN